MGTALATDTGRRALQIARSAERANRARRPQDLHDKVLAAVLDAGIAYELAVRAAWEAISE